MSTCWKAAILVTLCPVAVDPAWARLEDPTDEYCYTDADHDGYLDESSRRPLGHDGGCEIGWIRRVRGASGDCDDSNPAVHPRRPESEVNGRDDNCNGLTDEPEFMYLTDLASATPTSMALGVRVNSQVAREAGDSDRLWVHVSWVDLTDSSLEGARWIKADMNRLFNLRFVRVVLDRLQPGRVYQVNAQFGRTVQPVPATNYRSRPLPRPLAVMPASPGTTQAAVSRPLPIRPPGFVRRDLTLETPLIRVPVRPIVRPDIEVIGDPTGLPLYSLTLPEGGTAPDTRSTAVTRALSEFSQSESGLVGYRGSSHVDGTRYGASRGEFWCSEFYSWVAFTVPLNPGIEGADTVGDIIGYFRGHGTYDVLETTAEKREVLSRSLRGNYLAFDFTGGVENKTHSGMFLAYDVSRSDPVPHVWTVEGNAGNQVAVRRHAVEDGCAVAGHGGQTR